METLLFMLLVGGGIAFVLLYFFKWKPEYEERIAEELEEKAKQKEQEMIDEWKKDYELERNLLLLEVLKQAKMVGDKDAEQAVLNMTYEGPLPEVMEGFGMDRYMSVFPGLETFPIAGMKYRGNLSAYEGEFNGVLVPEPKNQYDPDAIKVLCEDGKHLGYIPEFLTHQVRDLVGEDFTAHRITGEIKDVGEKEFAGFVYVVGNKNREV